MMPEGRQVFFQQLHQSHYWHSRIRYVYRALHRIERPVALVARKFTLHILVNAFSDILNGVDVRKVLPADYRLFQATSA